MAIYLFYSQTGTWLSRSLNFVLREKYVHVSLSLDNNYNKMYSMGRVNYRNPFSGGFVVESINKGLYFHKKKAECLIYKIDVTKEQYYEIITNFEKYRSRKKLKYNFVGLITTFLKIKLSRRNHYFCSQLISKVLDETNVIDVKVPYEFIKPLDLLNYFPEKEKVFEGKIEDLRVEPPNLEEVFN